MKRKWKTVAMILCAAMLVSGCAPENDKEKKPENKTEKKAPVEKEYQAKLNAIGPTAYNNAEGLHLEKGAYISIIGKSQEGQYWEEVKKGVNQAAADLNAALGYGGKDKVKVTYSAPSNPDDVDEQVNILDEELARYPVALGIAIADEQACGVQFDLAAQSDIPVVALDTGSDYQGLMATISTDNTASAKMAADKLAETINGAGEVMIFTHDSKAKATRERVRGFQDEMSEKYPGVSVVNIYDMDQLEEMQKTVADEINAGTYQGKVKNSDVDVTAESITEEDVIDYVLSKNLNIRGCYVTNADAAKLAVESFERQKSDDVAIIGYDADDEEIAALKDGKIEGLIVQNPFGMGYASVIAAARASLNLGNEAYVNTGYTWVTKDNLDDDSIKKMLY